METRDHRKLSCPHCGENGTVYMDSVTSRFRCRKCHVSGFNPYEAAKPRAIAAEAEPKRAKRRPSAMQKPKQDKRPNIPEGALNSQVVEDFFVSYTMKGMDMTVVPGAERAVVSRTYCPKNAVKGGDDLFDPTTKAAQFYLKEHAPRFKNRRRYDRDLKRRGHGATTDQESD